MQRSHGWPELRSGCWAWRREILALWPKPKGGSGDDLQTLASDLDRARLLGSTGNRAFYLCQALFYVLRNFHAPGPVALPTAGSGMGSLGGAGVQATLTPTFSRHSGFGCEGK